MDYTSNEQMIATSDLAGSQCFPATSASHAHRAPTAPTRSRVCARVPARVLVRVPVCTVGVCARIHVCTGACPCACMCHCVQMCVRSYTCVCTRVCNSWCAEHGRAYVLVLVCAYGCASVFAMLLCAAVGALHAYMCARVPVCLRVHVCLCACMCTCV